MKSFTYCEDCLAPHFAVNKATLSQHVATDLNLNSSLPMEPVTTPGYDGRSTFPYFMNLPREIRDMVYSFAASSEVLLLPVEGQLLTQVIIDSMPYQPLLSVSHQLRAEVLALTRRRTSVTMLDVWDCRGGSSGKLPLLTRTVPLVVTDNIRSAEIALNVWSPIENDIGACLTLELSKN